METRKVQSDISLAKSFSFTNLSYVASYRKSRADFSSVSLLLGDYPLSNVGILCSCSPLYNFAYAEPIRVVFYLSGDLGLAYLNAQIFVVTVVIFNRLSVFKSRIPASWTSSRKVRWRISWAHLFCDSLLQLDFSISINVEYNFWQINWEGSKHSEIFFEISWYWICQGKIKVPSFQSISEHFSVHDSLISISRFEFNWRERNRNCISSRILIFISLVDY